MEATSSNILRAARGLDDASPAERREVRDGVVAAVRRERANAYPELSAQAIAAAADELAAADEHDAARLTALLRRLAELV